MGLTKEMFLEDTIEFFDSNNRGVAENENDCVYHNEDTGNRCAIGRYMTDLQAYKAENMLGLATIMEAKLMDERLIPFGRSFLASVQSLHDDNDLWDENGLNESGKAEVKEIIIEHNLNMEI